MENPFLSDVCRTPWHADQSVKSLNVDVLDQLVEVVGGRGAGPMMLLTAPRAGYGKTHLLGRVAAAAAGQAVIVPVAFRSGDPLTLATLSRRGIESLSETSSAGETPGWSRLRESAAQVVISLLRRLIESGQLPCANADQAAQVLSGPAAEVFDAQGKARRIGEWIRQNQESLRGPLAMLAARELPLRAEALDGWMAAFLDQSLCGGLSGMAEMQDLTTSDNDSGVPAWLRLLGIWRPVVLLVDHLDGFYRHPEAGVKIASMLMELVESHGLHVLLSLNQDVWQATFGHHLPSALEDRLTASQVLLRGLTEQDATELLRLRLDQIPLSAAERAEFENFVSVKRHFLGRPIGSVSARAFLRHCARQWEIFQSAPPSPPESTTDTPALPELPSTIVVSNASAEQESSTIPLMTETVQVEAGGKSSPPTLPALFDAETASDLQTMAESLAEPRHALPQDEPNPQTHAVDPAPPELLTESHSDEELLICPPPQEEPHPTSTQPTGMPHSGSNGSAAPTTDAFVKLREMLAQLRQPGQVPAGAPGQAALQASSPPAVPNSTPLKTTEAPFRVPQTAPVGPVAQATLTSPFKLAAEPPPLPTNGIVLPPPRTSPRVQASPTNALQGRFQALRLQHQAEAMSQPLDHSRLADLIRLAGRRFPLVRFSEHELPGLPGRHALYWALQGVEVLFGLAPFSDTAYWRTLSGFAAGRVTDLATQAERENRAPAHLKIVGFKTEREQHAWQNLLHHQILPAPIRQITDIVHLDTEGLAALYAMQRIIKESESGVLQTEPSQVISVLARDLDFFWKRITRVM